MSKITTYAPGQFCWVDLMSPDAVASRAFYGALFGWGAQDMSFDGGDDQASMDYTTWMLGEDMVGGMMAMDDSWPAEVPPHWMVYFGVEDCDAAAAQVTELGGEVCVPPTDIPPGRFAVVNDPQGATFSIISLSEYPE